MHNIHDSRSLDKRSNAQHIQPMQKNIEPCYYPEYLHLDQLLGSQHPLSHKYGEEAHEETLFIIVHQVYELWFKQILHELNSLLRVFSESNVSEQNIGLAISRIYRINSIQRLLTEQLNVLETMLPEDFLDFRNYIVPASGFQSLQFREIEIKLGLKSENRIQFDNRSVYTRLKEKDRNKMLELEKQTTLFESLESWLERTPFIKFSDFDFWEQYQFSVEKMLEKDLKIINDHPTLNDEDKKAQIRELNSTRANFETLFDQEKYNRLLNDGKRRMSQQATLAALFIRLYHTEPMLSPAARLLNALVDMDEYLTSWRYRHALMAQRMLGTKIGTGGSAGHQYLKQTTQANRIFTDLFNLSTYLIPKSELPKLPAEIKSNLNFLYNTKGQ